MKDKKLSLADYGVDFYKMTDQEILDFLKENEQSDVYNSAKEMLLHRPTREKLGDELISKIKEAFENKKILGAGYCGGEGIKDFTRPELTAFYYSPFII